MKKVLFLLILFICSFMITNKQVYAESVYTANFNMLEPTIDDNSAYIIVLARAKSTGKYFARLHYLHTINQYNYTDWSTYYQFNVDKDSLTMHTFINGEDAIGLLDFMYLWTESNYYETTSYSVEYQKSLSWTNAEYEIVSYYYKGNVQVWDYLPSTKVGFNIVWSDKATEIDVINALKNVLLSNAEDYDSMIRMLMGIQDNTYNTASKLSSLLKLIESNHSELYDLLDVYIKSIDNELNEIDINGERIIELLESWNNAQLGESTEPLPNSGITANKDKESALINKGSVGSITSGVGIELDTTANNSIWTIANSFITCNSLVFGLFISLLSLGVVKLILNR